MRATAQIRLSDYLDGISAATTANELEAAIQVPYEHSYRGRTWSRICKVRIASGQRICAAHPLGFYAPHFGQRRQLSVCKETYRVGRGQNSTGVRYVWHGAGEWAKDVLVRNGFSIRAAHRVWDGGWDTYPHRVLTVVDDALNGRIPDPDLNVLIRHERTDYGRPVKLTVEQNDAEELFRRATRPCECGGALFDWGGGHSEGFEFISWHCNQCPDVFTEYMTRQRFYELRSQTK